MFAILNDDFSATKNLLQLGADVNFKTKCFKISPLLLACKIGNLQIIKTLLKYKADYNHCDVLNRTCLMHILNRFCYYQYYEYETFNKRWHDNYNGTERERERDFS